MIDLKKLLNPEQYEAVTYNNGPLLVFAGAGSGKTRVITYKIYYLISELKVFPGNILAVTFTNKAADEMKQRIKELLEHNSHSLRHLWIGTFHSIGARILRIFGNEIGLKDNFVIYDEEDQVDLIRSIIGELGLDDRYFSPKKIAQIINKIKQERELTEINYDDYPYELLNIFNLYTEKLRKNNAVDFSDLLLLPVKLFLKKENIKKFLQEQFKYILVDEFQDTNIIQYKFVKLLAPPENNLCVVGDDDQSIYSWRGAYIYNILNFKSDFPTAKVVKLIRNYRSTKNILKSAVTVIKNNKQRAEKELITDNPVGDPLYLFPVEDELEEADKIVQIVKNEISNNRIEPNQIAVFYRINAQSRVLEEAFRREGIPYRVVGGFKFYERAEIKDLLAYLRVIHNQEDEVSLKRIINTPPRGIGKRTIERLIVEGRRRGESLWKGIEREALSNSKVRGFYLMMKKWIEEKDKIPPSKLLSEIIDEIGYREYLEKHYPDDFESRQQNIDEFLGSIVQFEERFEGESPTLEEFLIQTSLITSEDVEDKGRVVSLMTVHSAKGLEFDVVLIAGLEEDLFPYRRFGEEEDEEELEEERRLFYVALTRAKKRIYMFYTFRRNLFGRTFFPKNSRFIDELPKSCVVVISKYNYREEGRLLEEKGEEELYKKGTLVYHPVFGKGVVLSKKQSGSKLILTVQFLNVGVKNLIPSKLSILKGD